MRAVIANPVRLRFLLRDGWETPWQIVRFLRLVVPRAASTLRKIRSNALAIPDERLRTEALASIDAKAYHVAGASILATFLPRASARRYIELVTPLESIYDYLDNLCDRHPNVDPDAYPVLHQAIADALDPSASPRNYYARGPTGEDGGYLHGLVVRTQAALRGVDGYEILLPVFREAATLYSEMQTYKHYPPNERVRACVEWYERRRDGRSAGLAWYEFACAAGSQLQIYAPLFELMAGRRGSAQAAYDAYFPSVGALHVLLDSFIDQAEDREHGELNFASLYASPQNLRERITDLSRVSQEHLRALPDYRIHRFVLRVMLLFYLTHPKIYAQELNRPATAMLEIG